MANGIYHGVVTPGLKMKRRRWIKAVAFVLEPLYMSMRRRPQTGKPVMPEPVNSAMRRPILSGIRLKCGRCETGSLFKSYLKLADQCPECGLDLTVTDTADGPAFFVGFIAMILFAPGFLWVSFVAKSGLGLLIGYGICTLICAAFCLVFLPPFKAVLLNLQIRHQAGEGQFGYKGTHGKAPDNWKPAAKGATGQSTPDKSNENNDN